ncbi:MAG: DUF2057 family protein [Plesiomonas sp.]|uniref:DUF2057 family protein n=1 Tax=Plesiomonas sp. TaxID=2486279 RepID=UPI003F32C981
MKLRHLYAGMLALSCSAPLLAANLNVSNNIELLMVDGNKVPSSLLKSTNHIKLPNSTSQILFRVEKIVRSGSDQTLFTSSPIIVSFETTADQNVSIALPRLDTDSEGKRFNQALNFHLVDQTGKNIPYKSDVLNVDGLMSSRNMQDALASYNHSNAAAALADFAPVTAALAVPTTTNVVTPITPVSNTQTVSQQTVTLKGENVSEQMLQYWFQQADTKTQQRFMQWAQSHARK